MYNLSYAQVAEDLIFEVDPRTEIIPCKDGWEYNLTDVSSSVVIDVV